jgi:uncharacterized protein YeaO (DUF488 family)
MVVKTKSIYEHAEEEDGIRVLITRYYPRGVKKSHFDHWLRELSPSKELLFSYKGGKTSWSEFKINLLSEIKDNKDSLNAIYALNNYSRFDNVTLLCYEKAGNPCHRYLIRDLVDDPKVLSSNFKPKDPDDHEGVSIDTLLSQKETIPN